MLEAVPCNIRCPDSWFIIYGVVKKVRDQLIRGPARVLAVEAPESGNEVMGVSVVWLSHAGVLIRAAPEHLRMATPLEVSAEEAIRGDAAPPGLAIHRTVTGKDNS